MFEHLKVQLKTNTKRTPIFFINFRGLFFAHKTRYKFKRKITVL